MQVLILLLIVKLAAWTPALSIKIHWHIIKLSVHIYVCKRLLNIHLVLLLFIHRTMILTTHWVVEVHLKTHNYHIYSFYMTS